MVGDGERICQNNGDWSGQEPHCYSKKDLNKDSILFAIVLEMSILVQNSTGQYPFDSSKSLEVEEGKQLLLRCNVGEKHHPELGISWRQIKDDNVVDLPMMHDMKSGTSINGDYVYIQFDRVTSKAHERTYSCMSKKHPHLSQNITLKIKPKGNVRLVL